jgi:hypothetical protein
MTGPPNGGRARAYEALRESEELHRAPEGAELDQRPIAAILDRSGQSHQNTARRRVY